jgi:hypothetical protein
MAKLGGKRAKELLRVIEDGFLDVTSIGVQRLHLFVDSRYDTRVGVTDTGNVVVNVEILISVPVKQRDALATYYLHGGVIEEPVTGSEALFSASDVLLHLIRELTEAVGIKAIDHGSGGLTDLGSVHGFSLRRFSRAQSVEGSFGVGAAAVEASRSQSGFEWERRYSRL